MDIDYEEEPENYSKNNHYPKDVIEETDNLDFAIHILADRRNKLSKNGKLALKLDSCIKHLQFLKEIDDKYEWSCRDYAMLEAQYEQVCQDIINEHKKIGDKLYDISFNYYSKIYSGGIHAPVLRGRLEAAEEISLMFLAESDVGEIIEKAKVEAKNGVKNNGT